MKRISEMSRKELAVFICTYLEKHGKEVVLTGGSCVSIYSEDKYVTMDLDFVEITESKRKELAEILSKTGFYEENRYFKHPESELIVDFLSGPLAVGEEPIRDIITIETESGRLRIISPTECIKDRLAAYYHWNDRQCLEQAILVAQHSKINLQEIERWSIKEGHEKKLKDFLKIIRNRKGSK